MQLCYEIYPQASASSCKWIDEAPAHIRSSCFKPATTILQDWRLDSSQRDTMTVPTRLTQHVHATGDVGVVEIEAQGSSVTAKRTSKLQPATLVEDALPSQALSEDGTCSVWPLKGGPDLQLHLADVPRSCWTIPWQDTAAGNKADPVYRIQHLLPTWVHPLDRLILPRRASHCLHSTNTPPVLQEHRMLGAGGPPKTLLRQLTSGLMVQLPALSSSVAWGDLWVAPRGKAVCTMAHQQGQQPVFWLWARSSKAPQAAKDQVRARRCSAACCRV